MTTSTRVPPRPSAGSTPPGAAGTLCPLDRCRGRGALTLVAAGLTAIAAAGVALVHLGGHAPREVVAPAPPPSPLEPSPITISGSGDVTVVSQVYEPGETSGWHAHPGIHAVAVLSGTLKVYDRHCRAESFEPGRPYIGGRELHLVRNETTTPVEMVVTYLSPAAPGNSNLRPSPPACATGIPGGESNG